MYRAKSKTRKLRKWEFFLLNHIVKLKVFLLGHFFRFLDFELHILPKIEVKENFPRFLSFQFWIKDKIENSETSEIGNFLLLNHIVTL